MIFLSNAGFKALRFKSLAQQIIKRNGASILSLEAIHLKFSLLRVAIKGSQQKDSYEQGAEVSHRFFDVKYQVVGADHQNAEPKRRECTIYREAFAGNFFWRPPRHLPAGPRNSGQAFRYKSGFPQSQRTSGFPLQSLAGN